MNVRCVLLALSSVAFVACGGSTPDASLPVNPPAGQDVVVVTSPAQADVEPGASTRFGAQVTGTALTAVTWTVQEADGGTVDATGLYTAPSIEGTFHVRATSTATLKSNGTSAVRVKRKAGAIAVAISPSSPMVQAGATLTFTAAVTGTTAGQSSAVTWSVPPGCGVIGASSGVYVAPSSAATCVVTATSVADPSRTATASVAVAPPPVVVAISPATAAVDACKGQVFTATVTNASSSAVTWRVVEAGGGTVTNGIYTAPQAVGTFHVTATSVADPTRTAQATVTVGPEKVLSVAVSPGSGTVQANGAVGFTAKVTTTCGTF